MMDIYLPPSLDVEIRHTVISTWHDHLPFGYDLIAELKPKVLVELGTYSGLSFFCFCQAMAAHDVDGTCYAVDTWGGDEHTGTYGEEVYQVVNKHLRDYYRGLAYLLRMTFDEAIEHFSDDGIDLLHIDGLHTYDAVKHDFDHWYPKVKPGGIILFHDIEARMKDYGAWRFWQELTAHHQTFAFKHGYGLGILRKSGGTAAPGPLLSILFNGNAATQQKIRKFYAHISRYRDAVRRLRNLDKKSAGLDQAISSS
jgi:predicted O-methyltransferase YrrM